MHSTPFGVNRKSIGGEGVGVTGGHFYLPSVVKQYSIIALIMLVMLFPTNDV